MTETEEWRPCPGFPDYEASSLGRVKRVTDSGSWKAGRVLNPSVLHAGHHRVDLMRDGRPVHARVNRLVCEAFHGPAPTLKHHAAHGDGNPGNDRADNLRWATCKQNHADRDLHGRTARGARQGSAKLCDEAVRDIRARLTTGESKQEIADRYGVTRQTIGSIASGVGWRHVQ